MVLVPGWWLFEALLGLLPILAFGLQTVAGLLDAFLGGGLLLRGVGDRDRYTHQPEGLLPPDPNVVVPYVVGEYQRALSAGDLKAVLATTHR